MSQAGGVGPAQLFPQLSQDVVGNLVQIAQGACTDDMIGHQQNGFVGLRHPEQRRGAHPGTVGLQSHESRVLGRRAHGQVALGGEPLNANAVPQGGDEAGDLAVGVQNRHVAADTRGVPHGVEPVHRGPAHGQGGRGGLGHNRLQVDIGGGGDRGRLLRM